MIRLGSLAGYSFEGPWLLGGWTPPEQPGLFAVLYKPEPDTKAETYAVVYVGHSDNLAEEGFPWKHSAAHCWEERAGSKWQVYVCTFDPPGGGRSHREAMAAELIALYDPACNPTRFDRAWKAEWIGDYRTEVTGPLAPSGPDFFSGDTPVPDFFSGDTPVPDFFSGDTPVPPARDERGAHDRQ